MIAWGCPGPKGDPAVPAPGARGRRRSATRGRADVETTPTRRAVGVTPRDPDARASRPSPPTLGCQPAEQPARTGTATPAAPASFVGGAKCASCHPKEAEAYRTSDHARAMQPATPQTVLGNFDQATVTHRGVTSTFFRRGEKFLVRTDGPDGKPAEFEIAYTFGADPLQQYLVPFPDGRLQSLGLAWDTRPREAGGQRWFHLYPGVTLRPPDPLHWTGREQTWNFQCAECHSTNLRKGYDVAANRYTTTWAELTVSCEECHGPGSAHVAWAEARPGRARPGRRPARRGSSCASEGATERGPSRTPRAASPSGPDPRGLARRSTSARAAMRGGGRSSTPTRTGDRSSTPTCPRSSSPASTTPTGRSSAKSTSGAHSSRAACTAPG